MLMMAPGMPGPDNYGELTQIQVSVGWMSSTQHSQSLLRKGSVCGNVGLSLPCDSEIEEFE